MFVVNVKIITKFTKAPAQDSWNGELLGYAISWREVGRAAEVSEGAEGGREEAARAGTVVARGWSSAELTLGGLNQFARYAVTARAFNRAGPGPPSSTAYATTADGGMLYYILTYFLYTYIPLKQLQNF